MSESLKEVEQQQQQQQQQQPHEQLQRCLGLHNVVSADDDTVAQPRPSQVGSTDPQDQEQTSMSLDKPPIASASIRFAEARRIGTCQFANRVAAASVAHYHRCVPDTFRQAQPQTCLATIVAHVVKTTSDNDMDSSSDDSTLHVLAMGVGTKFLADPVLMLDHCSIAPGSHEDHHGRSCYGERVRDCHAEVLARRAFRRYLSNGILADVLSSSSVAPKDETGNDFVLERRASSTSAPQASSFPVQYQLKPGVTLHFYCSSTPCGNSTIKQFATLHKQVFRDDLGNDEWPNTNSTSPHLPIPGHSIALGQFALLLKRDTSVVASINGETTLIRRSLSPKQQAWPVNCQTDWCPPGTTTVWSGMGRLHSCSDKLARWNVLGYQGSLLSALLAEKALYMETMTVGRKFSEATCRRAICCRLETKQNKARDRSSSLSSCSVHAKRTDATVAHNDQRFGLLHHPVVMGTSVYMDETGVVDTSSKATLSNSQHVRFTSSESWASWRYVSVEHGDNDLLHAVECIDGATGWKVVRTDAGHENNSAHACRSQLCTMALTETFLDIQRAIQRLSHSVPSEHVAIDSGIALDTPTNSVTSLFELRNFKCAVSPEYEQAKLQLCTKHPVMRDWQRREQYQIALPAPNSRAS